MTVDLEEVIVTGAVAENVDAPLAEESAPASMTTAKPEAAPAFDFNPVLPQYLTGALATPAETSTSAGKATRIPAGWTFSGRIVSNGDVDIGCRVDGSITCLNPKSSVFLRAESSTVGDVKADSINVEGTLTGRIDGSNGSVTLAKSSKIEGEVRYSNIQMHGGVHRMKLEYVEPTMA
jgi:cytoskeletal protein CcmA (bactofilin family)